MRITEIRMFLCSDSKLKATLSITLEDAFVIKGVKVISGRQGLFLAMPSRRKDDGTYEDICHPINKSTRDTMEKQVLEHYLSLVGNRDSDDPPVGSPDSGSTPTTPPAASGADRPTRRPTDDGAPPMQPTN